jgi:hypothetical protein
MKKRAIYQTTDEEVEILVKGQEEPDYITGYFFRPTYEGADGWYFDYNFTPEGAWQRIMHFASQSLLVLIGGIGSGKTLGIGMSACVWAATTPDFKFLNVAQKEYQAAQMYDLIIERATDAPFANLIVSAVRRPHHKITLEFKFGTQTVHSTLEFMSVDRDATGIFSWRGDWINVEEAGLLDNLDEISRNLSTRLTGSTRTGRPYLGRFSFTSNPWETPHLWYLYDMAAADPENCFSLIVSTRVNKNVTDKQLREMLKHIPEDDRARFIDGSRPEGKGIYFNRSALAACEDPLSGEMVKKAVDEGIKGFTYATQYSCGVVHYGIPFVKDHLYIVIGDPGSDNAPGRNSPVIMVWDVTDFPQMPMILVNFWWGSGYGRISPFVDKLLELKLAYNAIFTGIDSTGPQKNFAELLNIQNFDPDADLNAPGSSGVAGLDFSGARKPAYLVAARLTIEGKMIGWPADCIGIRAQLANYDPLKDRAGQPKIPQDIVATVGMSCWVARILFNADLSEEDPEETLPVFANFGGRTRGTQRESRQERTKRAR